MGGALWGVPGMFLSVPFIAVLKIIFDRVDGLKPWGKLLGTDIPVETKRQKWWKKKKTKESLSEKIVDESE
jgi:hypothetical protein